MKSFSLLLFGSDRQMSLSPLSHLVHKFVERRHHDSRTKYFRLAFHHPLVSGRTKSCLPRRTTFCRRVSLKSLFDMFRLFARISNRTYLRKSWEIVSRKILQKKYAETELERSEEENWNQLNSKFSMRFSKISWRLRSLKNYDARCEYSRLSRRRKICSIRDI